MKSVTADAFIVSPSTLLRELLAEVLRSRLGVHCSGSADSIEAWPAKSTAQLLLIEGDVSRPAAEAIAQLSARRDVRVIRLSSAATIDEVVHEVRSALRVAPKSLEKLTPQETRVLIAVAAGQRNSDIARRHRRSVKTVEKHRASVQRKLGVRTAAELTAYAIRAGMLDLDAILGSRRGP